MTPDEYAAGLLWNKRRIDVERAFRNALGHGIAHSEEVADQLLPDLGVSPTEIALRKMQRKLAEQASKTRPH